MDAMPIPSVPVFWRELLRTYGFPIVLFALAVIPGLNFLYSGHGGLAWLFLPLCGPWVLLRAVLKIARGSEESRNWHKRFYKITAPSYVVLALPLSLAAAASIRMSFGLHVSPWEFYAIVVSPFPWWYFS
jgi:hypothetical protein